MTATITAIVCPRGHRHLLPVLTGECWADLPVPPTSPKPIPVTRREWDVAQELIRDGATNKEIGTRLFLSEDTVKSHTKSLLRRTSVDNRTAFLARIIQRQIRLVPVRNTSAVPHRETSEAVVP